jgi:hypothetical protein
MSEANGPTREVVPVALMSFLRRAGLDARWIDAVISLDVFVLFHLSCADIL